MFAYTGVTVTDMVQAVAVIGRVPADAMRWSAMEEEMVVEIARARLGNARTPIGLVVSGDCLKALGIFSGDIVICDRAEGRAPQHRQLVVVRVGEEVTLKRWVEADGRVELRDGDENVVKVLEPHDDVEVLAFYITYEPIAER